MDAPTRTAPIRALRVQRFGGARDITRGALYCFAGLLLTAAVVRVAAEALGSAALVLGLPLALCAVGLGIVGMVCALGSPILWLSALLSRQRPGVLRVDEGLRIDQAGVSTVMPLISVDAARISPFEDELLLRMIDGDVVRASIGSLEEGEQILQAVATETVRGTWLATLYRRPDNPSWTDWPWLSAVGVGLLAGLLAMPFTPADAALALGFSLGAGVRILAAWKRKGSSVGCIVLGRDGIAIKDSGRDRFLAYSAMQRVDETESGVVVALDDGEELALDVVSPEALRMKGEGALGLALAEHRRAHLVRRLQEELAAGQAEPVGAGALLERRGRSVDAWRSALCDLLREASGGYRTATLAREHAIQMIEDGRAPGELRIGAALALTMNEEGQRLRGGDAETAPRLRIAVETCVNQDVRTALRDAIYGELDDETLDRAMVADARR